MSNLSYWFRVKRFYRNYGIVLHLGGLFIGGHLLWWQIQQNPLFVNPEHRARKVGPIKIVYLDELEKSKSEEKSSSAK